MITIENVIAIPGKGLIDAENHSPIVDSFLYRNVRNKPTHVRYNSKFIENVIPVRTIDNAYYGGMKINHFGHFMLESLSRLRNVKESRQKNIIWLNLNAKKDFSFWQKDMFKILGLDNYNHIVINEPTLIKSITIVKPGYVTSDYFLKEHSNFLSIIESTPKIGKKIWISKANIEGGWINESEVEQYLKNDGWEIYHPELDCIENQIRKLASAEIISGIEGSGFHTLIFVKNPKCKVKIFSKSVQDKLGTGKVNENYPLIALVKNIDQTIFYPRQIVISGEGINTKYLVNTADVLADLGCNRGLDFNYFFSFLDFKTECELNNPENLDKCINMIVSSSIYLHKNNLNKDIAYHLMKIASKLRPNGQGIKDVLKSWDPKLTIKG